MYSAGAEGGEAADASGGGQRGRGAHGAAAYGGVAFIELARCEAGLLGGGKGEGDPVCPCAAERPGWGRQGLGRRLAWPSSGSLP